MLRSVIVCALLGSFAASQARAGEIYSYVDDDGVMHFSNVPTDKRYKKVRARPSGGGVYKADPRTEAAAVSPAKARAISRSAALEKYREHIDAAAEKYSLPVELLLAVMAVESHFNETALSEKGAVGLMQLMPGTAREMYVADAWAPEQNIDGGARYLRILANQYEGDLVKTLAAYNAGPNAVRRAGGKVPNIPETQAYVRKVLALYQAFRAGK